MEINLTNQNNILIDCLNIPDDTKYWFVRAGQRAEFFNDFKINNFIAIGDNEISLEKLKQIETKYRVDSDILKERYKHLFNSFYIDLIKSNEEFNKLTKSNQSDKLENVKRSSTISSYKAFSFIEEMKIGDYVFVPHRSSGAFLIGIIISDVFDTKIDHQYLGEDQEYSISNYDKKRRIAWIKEIDLCDLPSKLMWIQNGHKAIFDITQFAEEINPILASTYIYKNNIHLKINVTSTKNITSTEWLNYQVLVHKNAKEHADNLFQKTDVQSPGKIILETTINHWETIAIVFAALFTEPDIDIKGVKFKWHGPLSFLIPGSKQRRERQERQELAKLRIIESEADLKELEVEKAKRELKQNEYFNTDIDDKLIDRKNVDNIVYETSPIEKANKEQYQTIKEMGIKYQSTGIDISNETQRKISNQ